MLGKVQHSLLGLVQHTFSSNTAPCFSAEWNTFLPSVKSCDGGTHPCVIAWQETSFSLLSWWHGKENMWCWVCGDLLGGPLVVGHFQGAQIHWCFARKVWIAAARRRKCKTGTAGRHEHKPLRDLTSLWQFCQDKKAGSWLIPCTCLASSMERGSPPSMLCIFVPDVLVASRKDAALFKRRKRGWPSKKGSCCALHNYCNRSLQLLQSVSALEFKYSCCYNIGVGRDRRTSLAHWQRMDARAHPWSTGKHGEIIKFSSPPLGLWREAWLHWLEERSI